MIFSSRNRLNGTEALLCAIHAEVNSCLIVRLPEGISFTNDILA